MHKILRTHYFSENQASIENAYGELLLCCEEQGLTPPSLKTFARERRLVSSPHQEKRQREGNRAAYTLEELVWNGDGGFPPHGERPFDIAHIDHTEVDLMLRFNAEDKPVACRVWLSVLIDAKQLWHNLRGNTKALRDPRSCSSTHDPRGPWRAPSVTARFVTSLSMKLT